MYTACLLLFTWQRLVHQKLEGHSWHSNSSPSFWESSSVFGLGFSPGIVCLFISFTYLRSYISTVAGSASWRIPLGLQLIPGIILAIGCYSLPPSPRLLVLHGKCDEALASLARLRLRNPNEAEGDVLLQVFFTVRLCTPAHGDLLARTTGDAR